jgi:hypothetical protein
MGETEKKPVAEASYLTSRYTNYAAVRAQAKREQANKRRRALAKRKRMEERLKEKRDD